MSIIRISASSQKLGTTFVVMMVWRCIHMPIHNIWRCSATLHMYKIDVECSPKWFQPQHKCSGIVCTCPSSRISTSPLKLVQCFGDDVSVRVHPYAYPQYLKHCKNTWYMSNRCEKWSKVVYNLNHDIAASFTLDSDPEMPQSDLFLS